VLGEIGVESAWRIAVGAWPLEHLYSRVHTRGYGEIPVRKTVENRAARRTYERAGMSIAGFRTGTVFCQTEPTVDKSTRHER
jgi:hypothetical protein